MIKTIGVLALIASTGYILFKKYKQEIKEIEEKEEKEEKRLEQLGIPKKRVEEEMVPGDCNLVKALFAGIEYNNRWDVDFIDVESCLKNENVIHVGISDTPNRKKDLSFLIEIPSFNEKDDYYFPRINDYITTLSKASEHLWYNVVKVSEKEDVTIRPVHKLIGYFVISYTKQGDIEKHFKYVRIPSELYKSYARENRDGLSEYISALRSGREVIKKVKCYGMVDEDGDLISESEAIDVQLFFSMSFPLQGNELIKNIDLESGIKCLDYLVNAVEIINNVSKNENYKVTYDHIMFHAPNEKTGKWDFFKYYTSEVNEKTGKRNVVIGEYTY